MDVTMWLQYRKFHNLKELKQDGDYIVVTRPDRRDFDAFRDLPFHLNSPIIATPLLIKFMKYKRLPINTIIEFNVVYVTSMPMDEYCFDNCVTGQERS